ncbi:MAG: HAMP domain-containing histidine kinase [Spirochaetales bacterium]|nr:MAG: HAMP domain-containing histidine kinase [Spirochaetales bacterium]
MRKKLIAVFLILSVLPAGLLIWLGAVSIKSEEDRNRRQMAAIAAERLSAVNQKIVNIFLNLESQLTALPDMTDMNIDDIRSLARHSGLIRQIFIIDESGLLVYPSGDLPLSVQEKEFLDRTKELGLSAGLFLAETDEQPEEHGQPIALRSGWYTWYLGDGVNFIFWRRQDNPASGAFSITGMELNRMAVIAALIRELPDTDLAAAEKFRVSLADMQGNIVYQWGIYTPSENENPASVVPAAAPLSSWRLNYFIDPEADVSGGNRTAVILAPIIAVILALTGLSVYLYRESTRDIRDAMRRVTFVNQVSHELKTPLTNIRLYAEMLESGVQEEDEKNRRYAAVVAAESRRLSRLIGNVLTFAKEGKSGLTFNPVPAVPDDVISAVVESFKPSLVERHMELAVHLNAGFPVLLDRDAVEQITGNLISNAEKYAASGRYLRLATAMADEKTILTVEDRGPGIPPSHRERVFRPFYRISSRLTDGVTGTGIGLSIVRTLARLHGGEVRILPSAAGTVFEVRLHTPPVPDPSERKTKEGEGHDHTAG